MEQLENRVEHKFSIIEVIRSVLSESSPLDRNQKLVVLTLARHADAKGECFPGQPRIARICGLSERTVRGALKALDGVWFERMSTVGRGTVYNVRSQRKVDQCAQRNLDHLVGRRWFSVSS
ncbi:MAG: helix-turn-helix domain-containing protein [Symbiobacteriia bacterium]